MEKYIIIISTANVLFGFINFIGLYFLLYKFQKMFNPKPRKKP